MPQTNPEREQHEFAPAILREYDIRGRTGVNLSEEDAFWLGRAFGTFVRRRAGRENPVICVGYDGRLTSPALAQALTRGLLQTGARVENAGLGPSPMLYFAVKSRFADAGIMVTGSHNPPQDNGFKMLLQNGPVFGPMVREIGKIAATGDFENGEGTAESIDIREEYVARLLRDFTGKGLNVAWDAGHGAAAEIMTRLTEKLPGKHTILYGTIDGEFPAHHPDPSVDANLADLIRAVQENGCDLGVAFDGDGDRIGVVDEKGNILRSDILMTIYAREVLARHPGAIVVGDVKCSQVMFDEIARLGGRPVMWKTGNTLIKSKMAELGAPLAGELSGHIFFADRYYGFDDGLYCAVRLLNIVSESGSLSSLTANLPVLYNTPEIRIEVREEDKFALVGRVTESARKIPGAETDTIDGVRVTTKDGWWLLRASNTQNALAARAESPTPEGLARLKKTLAAEIAKLGYTLVFSP